MKLFSLTLSNTNDKILFCIWNTNFNHKLRLTLHVLNKLLRLRKTGNYGHFESFGLMGELQWYMNKKKHFDILGNMLIDYTVHKYEATAD